MGRDFNRRQFLRTAAGAAVAAAAGVPTLAGEKQGVAIIVDPSDTLASSPPARWAATELAHALTKRGVSAAIYENAAKAPATHFRILASGMTLTRRCRGTKVGAGTNTRRTRGSRAL